MNWDSQDARWKEEARLLLLSKGWSESGRIGGSMTFKDPTDGSVRFLMEAVRIHEDREQCVLEVMSS